METQEVLAQVAPAEKLQGAIAFNVIDLVAGREVLYLQRPDGLLDCKASSPYNHGELDFGNAIYLSGYIRITRYSPTHNVYIDVYALDVGQARARG